VRATLASRTAFSLAMLTMVGCAFIAKGVYQRIPHIEDEFAILWEAEVMAGGEIALPSPAEPRAFLVPFVVDHEGLRFGKYPPGWPAALSLGSRIDAPWLVNSVLAGFVVWLIYRLGMKFGGPKVGLLAAFLSALSPMFLILSGSLMSHTFSLLITLAFTLAWLDLFPFDKARPVSETPAAVLVAVAGLSLGLLLLTRPLTAVGVALPFGIHGIRLLLRGNPRDRKALLIIGGFVIFCALLLLIWQAALTGDPLRNPYTLWWPYDRLGFGPGVGVTETGHNAYWGYWNTIYSLRSGQHDLYGWPYLSWIFLPFGLFALRRKRMAWLVLATFPVLVGLYFFYWVGAWLYGPRYYVEALPAISIFSAAGIVWLAGWVGDTRSWIRFRRPAILGILLILAALNLRYYLPLRLEMMASLNNMSREHQQPFELIDLEHALVIVHPQQSWTEYGTLLTLGEPFSDRDLLLVYSRGTIGDQRLMSQFPDYEIYHYFPGDPGEFYPVQ
jgi:4-amino-4-deoxy-L-arabinose transferase-like glycosyltransferase